MDTLLAMPFPTISCAITTVLHVFTQILDSIPAGTVKKIEVVLPRVIDRLSELETSQEKEVWTEEQKRDRLLEYAVIILFLQKYFQLSE